VDDPAFQQAVTSTLAALPHDTVAHVTTFWASHAPQLVSNDRHASYAVLQLVGDPDQREAGLTRIENQLAAPGLQTEVGGIVTVNKDISQQITKDLARAESISTPLLMLLLVIIFGSVAAASLPLAIGVTAILGAFTALRAFTYLTDVSIFSINIVTILGLGLAIDYGLFVVSRFREELPRSATVGEAVAATMTTAGRTVAVSGVTVAISLSGLLLFPQVFLRSMGFGGMAAVLVAMLTALIVLPALLGVLGHRVDALSVRAPLRRLFHRPAPPALAVGGGGGGDGVVASGVWHRVAHSVMRRPVVYIVVIGGVLLALGLPFLRIAFGGVDVRALPASTQSRQVGETIDRDFARNAASPIDVVVTLPGPVSEPSQGAALGQFVQAVAHVPGVTAAQVTGAAGNTARISARYDPAPISPVAQDLVRQIRALPAPPGGSVLVGGQTAELVDLLGSVGSRLPWMGLLVVVATFVLLFLAFGSVVLPVKAVAVTALSLSASFGAMVWIFQDGHLSGFLGFTPTGAIEATQPILVLAIVFGLSMDYEVFLMSRIREEYDRTGDNTAAVAAGLQRTGRIITSAALLLTIVVGAFATSGITFIKLIGVATAIAILIDATVVRTLLVPAVMRLLGRANWYAPGPLRRVYARYGIHEGGPAVVVAAVPAGDPGHNGGPARRLDPAGEPDRDRDLDRDRDRLAAP
jgi:RND superfamily putative drug exporter